MSFDKYTHLYFICRFSTYIRDDRTNEENSFALVGGYLYLFSTHCIQVKTINSGRTVTYRLINLAIDTKSQLEVFLRRIHVKSVEIARRWGIASQQLEFHVYESCRHYSWLRNISPWNQHNRPYYERCLLRETSIRWTWFPRTVVRFVSHSFCLVLRSN